VILDRSLPIFDANSTRARPSATRRWPTGRNAEIVKLVNSSPGNLTPEFDAILEKAHSLCGASRGTLFFLDGEVFRVAASQGYPGGPLEGMRRGIAVSEDPRLASLPFATATAGWCAPAELRDCAADSVIKLAKVGDVDETLAPNQSLRIGHPSRRRGELRLGHLAEQAVSVVAVDRSWAACLESGVRPRVRIGRLCS
jgi:hypothetical protein